jgi:L-amino acid N-acyltransferase YncA
VRDLLPLDWEEVAAIYAEGIATGVASFEPGPPAWEAWDAAHPEIRVVAELVAGSAAGEAGGARPEDPAFGEGGRIAGWCALSPTSDRHCYRGVAEESVYVAGWAQGRGVGRALLEAVIARSEDAGIWTLQAGIFPENKPSLRLHLGCGFRLVGVRERLGESDGTWRDVLLLERRSEVVG